MEERINIERGKREDLKRGRVSIILYIQEGGAGIPNIAGRNSGGGRGMSNVDKGQTRREDEYSKKRMVEKSTRGGGEIPDEGGRGIPNEGGDTTISKGVGLQTDAGARGERFSFTTDGK